MEDTDEADLGFEVVVLGTSEDEISLQLVFNDPSAISSTRDGPDKLSLEITDLSMFVSAESDKAMDETSFDKDALQYTDLPPIIADLGLAEKMEKVMAVVEWVLYVILGLIFVHAVLHGASMQSLWSLVRVMQLIFLSAIVAVPYPAETYMFFNGRIFAKLDLFQGQTLAEKYFDFSAS